MDAETQALMQQMAETAARTAVQQTLLTFGIDPTQPLEAQKDMAALRELRELVDDDEFQKDQIHLRRWRKTMESIESRGVLAAMGLLCLGGLTLILFAFKMN